VAPEVIGHDRDCPARYAPRLAYRTEKGFRGLTLGG